MNVLHIDSTCVVAFEIRGCICVTALVVRVWHTSAARLLALRWNCGCDSCAVCVWVLRVVVLMRCVCCVLVWWYGGVLCVLVIQHHTSIALLAHSALSSTEPTQPQIPWENDNIWVLLSDSNTSMYTRVQFSLHLSIQSPTFEAWSFSYIHMKAVYRPHAKKAHIYIDISILLYNMGMIKGNFLLTSSLVSPPPLPCYKILRRKQRKLRVMRKRKRKRSPLFLSSQCSGIQLLWTRHWWSLVL